MIKIENLSTGYRSFKLKNINLTLEEGKITFLLGKNGSGKTTLIKSILGLKPYKGKISINNKSIDEVRDDLVSVFSEGGTYNFLSGKENMKYFGDNKDIVFSIDNKILKREIKTYSTGQSRKLAINIAFKQNKKIIICDEISSGLDFESIKVLKKTLENYKKQGAVILLTGHQFEFYNDIIDNIVVLANGEVRYSGDCKELLSNIGLYTEITTCETNPISKEIITQLGGVFEDNKIKIFFKNKIEYDDFKFKHCKNIDTITYNSDKVGVIYEKYMD